MRRVIAIAFVLIAASAISAFAAGTASAAKLTLTNEAGEPLPPEEFIESDGVNNISFHTPEGNLECNGGVSTGIGAVLRTNGQNVDAMEVIESEGFFTGEHTCFGGPGYTEPSLVSTGIVKLRANGTATWGPFVLRLFFERTNDDCLYAAGHLTGSNTATSVSEPVEIEFEHKLPLDKAYENPENSTKCPKYAEMTLDLYDTSAYEHTAP